MVQAVFGSPIPVHSRLRASLTKAHLGRSIAQPTFDTPLMKTKKETIDYV